MRNEELFYGGSKFFTIHYSLLPFFCTFAGNNALMSMEATVMTLLFALESMLQLDILAWVIGLPLLVGAAWLLWHQTKQRKRLDNELAQLKKMKRYSIEYEMVIKAMKLCIWRIDIPTRTVSINSDYRGYTDSVVPPPNSTYEYVIERLLPEYRDAIRKGLQDVINGAIDDFHIQYQVKDPDNEQPYWSETFVTVEKRDHAGQPLTLVGTTKRIDEQKQIEQALMDALFHAEESDRLKSAFLANISHEIRTPLNSIVGFSEVLPMAENAEEYQRLVDHIRQSNAQLLHLFDDIVNMSKLEARGGGEIKLSEFRLQSLMISLKEKYAVRADMKGLTLEIKDDASMPMLHTDRDRLREILNQYIDNALKFTTSGTITLGCDDLKDRWRIWVKDTGQGIPADKCNDALFDRFVKVDEFVPGTGLGLSICRSMALTLGGEVGVSSELGKGSLFWVELYKK